MERITQNDVEDFQTNDFRSDYRLRALQKMLPSIKEKVLDIGSGNGEIAIYLSRKAKITYATDYSTALVKLLKKKVNNIPRLRVLRLNAVNFSLKEKDFSLITACDVAEHLEDDDAFFRNCFNHLKKNGLLFVSVPAGRLLYGIRDKRYGHFRRYEKKELEEKIRMAGLRIIGLHYWNLIGVVPYWISEKVMRKALIGPARKVEQNICSYLVNQCLYIWLSIESKIKWLPFGLSLIVLAKKDNK